MHCHVGPSPRPLVLITFDPLSASRFRQIDKRPGQLFYQRRILSSGSSQSNIDLEALNVTQHERLALTLLTTGACEKTD
jgi:hypothetical protein